MMYCENCGKKLIRGYQFCMECGTPVPPEQSEDEAPAPAEAAQPDSGAEMPGIKPNSEEGTLVFCPTCGMRMQKSTEYCEKCGMKLGGNSGSVPLVNTDPIGGGDFSGMSDSDIAQIDSFVNNSGFDGSGISYGTNDYDPADAFGGGNLNSEIEALNQQFANLNATASDMPAISAPVHEPEPEPAPAPAVHEPEPFSRRVEDFSMDAGMPETQFLSESGLPVINGGEMSEPDTPVDLEHHLDDIDIDAEPVFTPASEAPVYSEPEPVFTSPADESPAYTEPESAAPAEEAPASTEPELSTSPYGNNEPAATFDPPLSTSPYGYSEPESAAPTEEAPAFTEPELSTSPYGNNEPAASFDPPLSTSPYGYSEPESAAPAEEAPAFTEPELSTSPYGNSEPSEPVRLNRPEPSPEPKAEASEGENADLGKLIYCRNCGQDMYEKEAVCKNCGSPNKWNVKPLKKSVSGGAAKTEKEPFKLFGVISIPAIIGAAVVVVGAIVLIVSTAVNQKPNSSIINSGTTISFNSNTDTSADSTPDDSAPANDVNPIIPVTSEQSEPEQPSVSEDAPAPAETAEVTATADDAPSGESQGMTAEPDDTSAPETPGRETDDPANTSKPTTKPSTSSNTSSNSRPTTTTKPAATTKPSATTSRPTATTKPATTTKPAATKPAATTRPTVTTTTAKPAVPVAAKPTAAVTSEDKQRAKMLDAFEAMSAEVGKLHIYSQATLSALDEGKTRTFYTSGMTSTLSSGKTNVANLYKNAEPASAQFDAAYQTLGKLYDLYTDYYTYVTTSPDSYDTYSTKESTKLGSFNSTVKSSFSYSKLQTENQTSDDKSRTYAEIMTDASSAASNAVSKFSTVKASAEKLASGTFTDKALTTIYSDNTSGILSAAGYYQVTIGYYNMLSSGAPSGFSSAKSALSSTANDLEDLLGIFALANENSLSGFKSETTSVIKSANDNISTINSSL